MSPAVGAGRRRRRIVYMARSVGDRKQTEAVVQRMLVVSKELAEVAEHSLRPGPVDTLSEHEHRVVRSFSEGKSPADIVRELEISPQTLRNHLHHINQELGTHNRVEAVTHALRRKLTRYRSAGDLFPRSPTDVSAQVQTHHCSPSGGSRTTEPWTSGRLNPPIVRDVVPTRSVTPRGAHRTVFQGRRPFSPVGSQGVHGAPIRIRARRHRGR